MESLLVILGRLWFIITSFIRRAKTDSPSVLPLSKVSKRSKPLAHREDVNDDLVWHLHKEEFLRHPSLRTAKKNRQLAKTKSTKKTHKHNKPARFAQHPFKAQDFNISILSANTQPPPRPPRPPFRPVPDVIITPCTPTGVDRILSTNHEFIYKTPFISPLDLTIAALSPKHHFSPPTQLNHEIEVSDRDRKPGLDPSVNEDDITDMYNIVSSGFAVSRGRLDVAISECPEKCSELSDSLDGDRSTQDQNFYVRSTPPWMNSDSGRSSDPSYVTSTPVKRSIPDVRQPTTSQYDTPISAATSLRLPDEQLDLLPYPDIFDLDMYYGSQSLRRSSGSTNHSSSFVIRSSSDDKNPFAVQSPHYLSSSPSPSSSPSNFGDTPNRPPIFDFVPETPVIDHEIKRYREHYRENRSPHSPHASESTSGESLSNYTPTPNPRAMSVNASGRPSLPLLPLRDTSRTMNILARQPTYPRVTPKKVTSQTKSQRRRTIRNNGKTPLPIVVVSHHCFGSFAQDSEPDTDASPEVLRARLRKTFDNFSKSISTENSASVEVQSFR